MVKMPSVTLPVAGTISTYTPLLGLQGVIGVKSGFTTAAGGCDVLGVVRTVNGKPVLLLAAVTGQTGPVVLAQAALHALALVDALAPLIGSTAVLAGHQVVAHVSEDGGASVTATTVSSASMLTWPGVTATRVFVPARHVADQAARGTLVGTVVVTVGTQRVAVPVRLERACRPSRSSSACSDRESSSTLSFLGARRRQRSITNSRISSSPCSRNALFSSSGYRRDVTALGAGSEVWTCRRAGAAAHGTCIARPVRMRDPEPTMTTHR